MCEFRTPAVTASFISWSERHASSVSAGLQFLNGEHIIRGFLVLPVFKGWGSRQMVVGGWSGAHRNDYFSCWLCNCTVSGMWLGGMDRISHHLKGESNQPQSLATGSRAFESQCFISKHKLLDRGCFFLFYCPRLYSEEKVVTVRRSEGGCGVYICNVTPRPWSGFLCLLAGRSCGWSNHVCRMSHWFPRLANCGALVKFYLSW